jgi:hypothetical protein
LVALTESASELAASAFSGVSFVSSATVSESSHLKAAQGAYLSLLAQDEAIQVALLATESGCQFLAKALLGIPASAEDLSDSDMSDAVCEIVNMMAGGLKQRISAELRVVTGLPIFVTGHPLPNPHQEMLVQEGAIGDVPVSLLVLAPRNMSNEAQRSAAELLH